MVDKQVIIDGCDVAGCEYLGLYKECKLKCGSCCPVDCKDNPNCYYKQLKRKEQECEVIVADAEVTYTHLEHRIEMCDLLGKSLKVKEQECDKLKQTLTEIKPTLELYASSKIGEEQLDGTYKITVKNSSVLGDTYITFDPRPAKQALQKISGCEVKDER